jgi:hypothetical protein
MLKALQAWKWMEDAVATDENLNAAKTGHPRPLCNQAGPRNDLITVLKDLASSVTYLPYRGVLFLLKKISCGQDIFTVNARHMTRCRTELI